MKRPTLRRTTASARVARPPLRRMLQVHQSLLAGKYPNCRRLAVELEVSAKTIQRDIDFMRDQLNLPIEYDQLHFGFYYSEPVTSFPSIEVSEGEIVAMFVARKALAQYKGTPFERPLRAAFGKISDGLQEKINFQWEEVDSAISFRGLGASIADLDAFEIVSKAVLRSRELTFEYQKLESDKFETRRVQPYHLACVENQWYLFAHDLARRQLRTFALPRLRKVKETGTTFHRPADFSITRYLHGSFGVFRGKGRHEVRIQFDAFAARLVGERQWHPSQKIKPLGAGGIELAMELASLEEVERWILSWGKHARVVAPNELAETIRAVAKDVRAFYQ